MINFNCNIKITITYRRPGIFILREEVHVSEGVDGDQRQVLLPLPEVVEGVGELDAVGGQELNLAPLPQQFSLY